MSSTLSLPTSSSTSTTIRQHTYKKLTPPPSTTARTPSALSPFHTCLDEHISSNTLSSVDGSTSRLTMYATTSQPGSSLSTDASTTPVVQSSSSANLSSLLNRRRSSSQRIRALRNLSRSVSRDAPSASTDAGVPLIERPTSFSALTRRQISKLTALALRRESDLDSFASEPVSYSPSTYIASDMWLAQRGVETAERKLAEQHAAKQKARAAQMHAQSPAPKATVTASANPADVFSAQAQTQDLSSKLVRMFFSGQTANPGPAPGHSMRAFDRPSYGSMRSMRVRAGRGATRGSERMYSSDRGFGVQMSTLQDECGRKYGSNVGARNAHRHSAPEAMRYDRGAAQSCERRDKFRAVKRFRWWLRRMSHRMKGEYEYM